MITEHVVNYAEIKKNNDNKPEGGNINISIDAMTAKKDMLEIKYTFEIVYANEIGTIKLSGVIKAKEKNAKKIYEGWRNSNKIPDELGKELFDAITFVGRVKATFITRALEAKIEPTDVKPPEPTTPRAPAA